MTKAILYINLIFEKIFLLVCRVVNSVYYYFEDKKEILRINAFIRAIGPHFWHYNYGDDLNYYILSTLSKKKIYNNRVLFNRKATNIMCIGSIVEEHSTPGTIIWGAGAMYGGNHQMRHKPKKVLAVRGPLTRNYLLSQGIDCPKVYGDPALLLPYIYRPKCTKKFKLGIIPHYVDFNDKRLKEFIANNHGTTVISLIEYKHWQDVIDRINECEYIISSSLHGLIIADAYAIPNAWIKLSDKIAGGDFKYRDYFGSVNREFREPHLFCKKTDIEIVINWVSDWQPIQYDPTSLLNSCPFEIKTIFDIVK